MRHAWPILCAVLIFPATGPAADTPQTRGDGAKHEARAVSGEAGALKQGFARIAGARFLDVDGNIRRLGDENGAGPAALVFVDGECPVSTHYPGELNDFAAAAEAAGIFRPGNPSVVHHANFFADYSGRARREDAKDAEPGFSVFGTGTFMSYDSTGEDASGIGIWAPGAEPYSLPQGVGLWLPAGGDIVLEIHYKLNGRASVDQSEIGLYFAGRPTPEYIDSLLVGTQGIDIAPDETAHVRHVSMDVPVGFRLVDAMPHMHFIGAKTRMVVTFPDGRTHSVFGIEDWDRRWQNIYALRTPLHVPAGSRIDAWFMWDNPKDNVDNPFDPPRRIRWGWKSEDEMAEVWLGVVPDDPSRRLELIEAANASWYGADSRPLP